MSLLCQEYHDVIARQVKMASQNTHSDGKVKLRHFWLINPQFGQAYSALTSPTAVSRALKDRARATPLVGLNNLTFIGYLSART
jgi:hypothetical protein